MRRKKGSDANMKFYNCGGDRLVQLFYSSAILERIG